MPHKLLLADDSVTIQRVIELTFADEDVQVIAVGNGQDAIERVQRDHPDIVLADVGMPERNGYEVAAFVKGNAATAHIPVVLLTGAFEPVDEGRARTVGCDGVLVKPFEPQLVISRVKELLAGRQPAGMWSGAPPAQGPVRQAPTEFDMRAAAPSGSTAGTVGDPLEAYFDQLDAAFASPGGMSSPSAAADPFSGMATPQAQPPAASGRRDAIPLARRPAPTPAPSGGDPLSGWDPELAGDPVRPAPVAPLIAARAPAPPVEPAAPPDASAAPPLAPPSAAAAAPAAPAPAPLPVSLVDAFAALLEAEQKIGLQPSAATTAVGAPPQPPAAPRTDEMSDAMIEAVSERVLTRLTAHSRPTILDVAEKLVREEIDRIKHSENL
jgi:CheY-like chemotaxis protein